MLKMTMLDIPRRELLRRLERAGVIRKHFMDHGEFSNCQRYKVLKPEALPSILKPEYEFRGELLEALP